MASTASPYGIQPIGDQSGTPRTLRIPNGIASGLSSNILKFQPVMLDTTNGTITPITATTDKIFGVFAGVDYTPAGGRPTMSPYWPASTTYTAGQGDMFAYIWPAWIPGARWLVQADGAVAQADFGAQFNFLASSLSSGSTQVGLSTASANHTSIAGASQGQLVLFEFNPGVNDVIGDAYTDLIVGIAYPQIVSGYQTSAG